MGGIEKRSRRGNTEKQRRGAAEGGLPSVRFVSEVNGAWRSTTLRPAFIRTLVLGYQERPSIEVWNISF